MESMNYPHSPSRLQRARFVVEGEPAELLTPEACHYLLRLGADAMFHVLAGLLTVNGGLTEPGRTALLGVLEWDGDELSESDHVTGQLVGFGLERVVRDALMSGRENTPKAA